MMRAALDAARAAGSLTLLRRNFASEPRVTGFVLAVGERLALVHQFHDFLDDGWTVLRIADLESIDTDEARGFFARAFRELDHVPRSPPIALPVTTFADALRALHEHALPVIIECETAAGGDADRYDLGAIVDVTDLHVHLRPVDGAGHWVAIEAIPLKQVTRVHVATPYMTTFLRYADPPEAA